MHVLAPGSGQAEIQHLLGSGGILTRDRMTLKRGVAEIVQLFPGVGEPARPDADAVAVAPQFARADRDAVQLGEPRRINREGQHALVGGPGRNLPHGSPLKRTGLAPSTPRTCIASVAGAAAWYVCGRPFSTR